jgi:hypothetical protein
MCRKKSAESHHRTAEFGKEAFGFPLITPAISAKTLY